MPCSTRYWVYASGASAATEPDVDVVDVVVDVAADGASSFADSADEHDATEPIRANAARPATVDRTIMCFTPVTVSGPDEPPIVAGYASAV